MRFKAFLLFLLMSFGLILTARADTHYITFYSINDTNQDWYVLCYGPWFRQTQCAKSPKGMVQFYTANDKLTSPYGGWNCQVFQDSGCADWVSTIDEFNIPDDSITQAYLLITPYQGNDPDYKTNLDVSTQSKAR